MLLDPLRRGPQGAMMKSLAAEAVDPSRRLSVPDAGGCDNTKPNPADSRLDSVLDRM